MFGIHAGAIGLVMGLSEGRIFGHLFRHGNGRDGQIDAGEKIRLDANLLVGFKDVALILNNAFGLVSYSD